MCSSSASSFVGLFGGGYGFLRVVAHRRYILLVPWRDSGLRSRFWLKRDKAGVLSDLVTFCSVLAMEAFQAGYGTSFLPSIFLVALVPGGVGGDGNGACGVDRDGDGVGDDGGGDDDADGV